MKEKIGVIVREAILYTCGFPVITASRVVDCVLAKLKSGLDLDDAKTADVKDTLNKFYLSFGDEKIVGTMTLLEQSEQITQDVFEYLCDNKCKELESLIKAGIADTVPAGCGFALVIDKKRVSDIGAIVFGIGDYV